MLQQRGMPGGTVIESMMFEGCTELTEVIFLGPVVGFLFL